MNALEAILRRPRLVITMMIVIVATGVLSYINVPKEANPDIDVPVYIISVMQAGISPEDSVRLLVKPMETKLSGLEGLKEITATAGEGYAAVVLEFNVGVDQDATLADIRDKLDQAQAQFPADAEEATIAETNFSLVPTIVVALSGEVPERTLYRHAKDLADQIEALPMVLEANLKGTREEVLEVIIDNTKLEAYGITQGEIVNALQQNNKLIPAGSLDNDQGRFNVKVPGLIASWRDVASLPIRASGDGIVTVGELTEIRRTFKDAETFTRINGRPAFAIEVIKRIGENIIENNAAVRSLVEDISKDWPSSIHIDFMLDQSTFIGEVLGSLQSAILTAISLVMILVVASLGLRSGLFVGVAIPTSLMTGFLILGLMGTTVNMMVLFGLVLTVGMLVDGAIVIVEYADRKIAEGLARREAYIRAARLMFWPIVTSTATTLAAFLPMLFWPGVPGEFMSYLPFMVIIVLSASLMTALIFLPVTGGLLARKRARPEEQRLAKRLADAEAFDKRDVRGLAGVYVRLLSRIIKTPIVVLLFVIAGAVAILYIYAQNNSGGEFFVEEEPDVAVAFVSARGNLAAREKLSLMQDVEGELLQVKGIKNLLMTSGRVANSVIGGVQDKPNDAIGEFQIEFEDYAIRRKANLIFDEIRARTAKYAGIKVEVRKIEGGPPTGKKVQLQISSINYDTVLKATTRTRKGIDTTISGLRDVEDTRPLPGIEWRIDIDRQKASRFGASIAMVGPFLQLVTTGILIDHYRPEDSEDEEEIRLRLPVGQRTLDRLNQIRIPTEKGVVPASNFITRTAQPKVSSITRKDGLYAITIKADVMPGEDPKDKIKDIQAWLDGQKWPSNVFFRFRGSDEEEKESQAFLGRAAMVSLFLMFIILVTQFNSFYQTILTLSTVILAVFGALLGMVITGQKFSIIMTGTGIMALAGIVVNNAIVLIDTYNRFRRQGLDIESAVLKTATQRVRPVLLTTITTIAGLVPMATQINFDFFNRITQVGSITSIWWVQLSTAIISGLAFSTVLTLIIVPTMLAAPKTAMPRVRAWGYEHLWQPITCMIGKVSAKPQDGTQVDADANDDVVFTSLPELVHVREQAQETTPNAEPDKALTLIKQPAE